MTQAFAHINNWLLLCWRPIYSELAFAQALGTAQVTDGHFWMCGQEHGRHPGSFPAVSRLLRRLLPCPLRLAGLCPFSESVETEMQTECMLEKKIQPTTVRRSLSLFSKPPITTLSDHLKIGSQGAVPLCVVENMNFKTDPELCVSVMGSQPSKEPSDHAGRCILHAFQTLLAVKW